MKISPISINLNCKSISNFKGEKEDKKAKPVVDIGPDVPDNEVVTYGTWGSNYVFPITAGQIRKMNENSGNISIQTETKNFSCKQETPEEYYKRKLYSTEWTT